MNLIVASSMFGVVVQNKKQAFWFAAGDTTLDQRYQDDV